MKGRLIILAFLSALFLFEPPLLAKWEPKTGKEAHDGFFKLLKETDPFFEGKMAKLEEYCERYFHGVAYDYYRQIVIVEKRKKVFEELLGGTSKGHTEPRNKPAPSKDRSKEEREDIVFEGPGETMEGYLAPWKWEIDELMKKMVTECLVREKECKSLETEIENALNKCDFNVAEKKRKELIYKAGGGYRYECPLSMSLALAKSVYPNKISRGDELRKEVDKANDAMKEGKQAEKECKAWQAPDSFPEILKECRPDLITQLQDQAKKDNQIARDFEQYKLEKKNAVETGRKALWECRNFSGVLNRISELEKSPMAQCIDDMWTDLDELKNDILVKQDDLETRRKKINEILSQTNNSLIKCDWATLDRQISDAYKSFPEENCMKNQVIFEELHYKVSELEQKKEVRIREYSPLRQEIVLRIGFCEGYFKAPGKGIMSGKKPGIRMPFTNITKKELCLLTISGRHLKTGMGIVFEI